MAIKPLNGKMVLPRQLTPLVAPPTAPRAKNLGMIFKKSIANQYQIPSEVEKPKKKHFWLMSHFSAFRQVVYLPLHEKRVYSLRKSKNLIFPDANATIPDE